MGCDVSTHQRMLGDRTGTTRQRWSLFGLILAVMLVAPAFERTEPQSIRVGAEAALASAAGTVSGATYAEHPDRVTKASFSDLWVTSASPSWRHEVQCVEAPEGVTAGELLAVDIRAVDPRGKPLGNALVEMTWQLPGETYRVSGRTSPLGRMTSRHLLPSECKGKRCIVAVRVTRDQLEGLAYCAFVPN
jgi:hypothetical protein